MNRAYLLLGSNLGDRKNNLSKARTLIASKIGSVKQQSSLYETAAWGITNQPSFFNQAMLIETALSPEVLLSELQIIEKRAGRIRFMKWGERIIDIDILFYNEEVVEKEGLTIPHPYLHLRKFTIVPLMEIAPDLRHPKLYLTLKEILTRCEDELDVERIGDGVEMNLP